MNAKNEKCTLIELLKTDSKGWGWMGHDIRRPDFWARNGHKNPYAAAKRMDMLLVDTCNSVRLNAGAMQEFADSTWGRRLGDELCSAFNLREMRKAALRHVLAFIEYEAKAGER